MKGKEYIKISLTDRENKRNLAISLRQHLSAVS